jgi:hypothetical protein
MESLNSKLERNAVVSACFGGVASMTALGKKTLQNETSL